VLGIGVRRAQYILARLSVPELVQFAWATISHLPAFVALFLQEVVQEVLGVPRLGVKSAKVLER
jgi:hypothetical protein